MQVLPINIGSAWSPDIGIPRNAFFLRLLQFDKADAARVRISVNGTSMDVVAGAVYPLITPSQIRAEVAYEVSLENKYRPGSIRVRLDLPVSRTVERCRCCIAFIERPDRRDDVDVPRDWPITQEWLCPATTLPVNLPADYNDKNVGVYPARGFRTGTWALSCLEDVPYMVSIIGLGRHVGETMIHPIPIMPLFMIPELSIGGVGGVGHVGTSVRRNYALPFQIPPGVEYLRLRAWRLLDARTGTIEASRLVLSTALSTDRDRRISEDSGGYYSAVADRYVGCIANTTGTNMATRGVIRRNVAGNYSWTLASFNNGGANTGEDQHITGTISTAAVAAIHTNITGPVVTSDCLSLMVNTVVGEGFYSIRYIGERA